MFQIVIINDRKLLLAVKSGNERVCAFMAVDNFQSLGGGGGGLMTGGGCGRGRAPSCNQKGGLGERCKLPQCQPLSGGRRI